MGFAWQDSATVLGGLLRHRGQDPRGVTSTAEAWAAFEEFLQADVDGICRPVDEYDSDGFFVRWNRQFLTLRRQLAIAGKPEDMADEFWEPEYWQVDLELVYGDGEDLFDEYDADTGFYCFDNAEDLRTGHADVRGTCQPLRMALGRTPVSSSLTFECVH
jgi:hypothetical protein